MLKLNITAHLEAVKDVFDQCFSNLEPTFLKLLRNPFQAQLVDIENHQPDKIIELKNDFGA